MRDAKKALKDQVQESAHQETQRRQSIYLTNVIATDSTNAAGVFRLKSDVLRGNIGVLNTDGVTGLSNYFSWYIFGFFLKV